MIAVITLIENNAPKDEIIPIIDRLTSALEETSIFLQVQDIHYSVTASKPPQSREVSVGVVSSNPDLDKMNYMF